MIPFNPNLPEGKDDYQKRLSVRLTEVLRDLGTRLDLLSQGHLAGVRGQATAAPTTGTWAKGDFIRNSAPSEAGTALSKYIVFGWECTIDGTPGTWLEVRTLTGN